MNEFSNALSVSASGLRAQTVRLRHLSENISNADTPGYRRKTVAFQPDDTSRNGISTVKTSKTQLDSTKLEQICDPNHPLSNSDGHYEGSNVNLLVELADAREAQRSYEANLKMFEQVQSMSGSLLQLRRR